MEDRPKRKVLLRSRVQKITKVVIVGDSRIEGLNHYLEGNPPITASNTRIDISTYMFKGATLSGLSERITRIGHITDSANIIVFIGGICSLTTKEGNLVYYPHTKEEEVRREIQDIFQKFGSKAHIATIPPANLTKASARALKGNHREVTQTDLETQQKRLLEDIEKINNCIIEHSIRRNTPTLKLASTCMKQSKKWNKQKTRQKTSVVFKHNSLRDGVHPNHEMKKLWFVFTRKFIEKLTLEKDEPQATTSKQEQSNSEQDSESQRSSSNSESDSDSDHGAFQRKRRQ